MPDDTCILPRKTPKASGVRNYFKVLELSGTTPMTHSFVAVPLLVSVSIASTAETAIVLASAVILFEPS